MNATENKAREWLSRSQGLNRDKILYYPNRTPDFILPDGSKYEVKLLYKDKIILFPSQLKAFREQLDITVLVFARGSLGPMATIPVEELLTAISNKVMKWQNINLVVYGEGRHLIQVYLPPNVQVAMDKYIADKYSPSTRVTTAIVTRAVSEFLEKEGYLKRQGGVG